MNRAGFLVWNPAASLPTHVHATYGDAVKESERLAQLHPGQTFHVMASVGHSLVEKPVIYRPNDDWSFSPF